jgi:hypothetical protein
MYDAEDLANIGKNSICEDLFCSQSLEPYFRTVYDNGEEFMVLKVASSIDESDIVEWEQASESQEKGCRIRITPQLALAS